MKIDFGYVSICLSEYNCSPAGNVTVTQAEKLPSQEARIRRIKGVALKNLQNTKRIMFFNKAHGIALYRFASQLIPLATHEITDGWPWWEDTEIAAELKNIGSLIKKNDFKVSTHPPQVCVLNSPDPHGFQWVEKYLDYHNRLLDLMGLDDTAKIVFHVGGGYGDLDKSLEQAAANYNHLSPELRRRIVLENDDTTFSAVQVLHLCQKIGAPMVLDIHHHWCRNDGENIEEILPDIFATWYDRPPKIHVSTPKSKKDFRSHADYIDTEKVLPFLHIAKNVGPFDIMVEAKAKDKALLRFRSELASRGFR